ncbi:MAG: hypothetical protein Q9210_002082 [Variospora velana]
MTDEAELALLSRADGSAIHTSNGYTIIGAVNGPVEVQRKDEIPEEAAIDVVIRPAAGVGSQPASRCYAGGGNRVKFSPPICFGIIAALWLGALLQSSMLALLSTSLPLNMAFTSALVAVTPSGELVGGPRYGNIKEALSLHVLAFSSHGNLLLAESEGAFDMDTWDQVYSTAERICRGSNAEDIDGSHDINMEPPADSLESSLRNVLQEKTAREQRWKEGLN